MENNADNQFPDLLSAALSESGLSGNLDDFDHGNDDINTVTPVQTVPQTFTTPSRIQFISTPVPQGGLASVSPSTVQLLGRRVVSGNPVVVNRNQTPQASPVQKIVKVIQTPVRDAAGNTQTVKKIVIQRTPTPGVNVQNQGARIVSLPGGRVVNVPQASQPGTVSSQAVSASQLQAIQGAGGYKVIRMASPNPSTVVAAGASPAAAGQVVTMPSGDGKRFRIIPVKAAPASSSAVPYQTAGAAITSHISTSSSNSSSAPKILRIVSSQPALSTPRTVVVPATSTDATSVGLPAVVTTVAGAPSTKNAATHNITLSHASSSSSNTLTSVVSASAAAPLTTAQNQAVPIVASSVSLSNSVDCPGASALSQALITTASGQQTLTTAQQSPASQPSPMVKATDSQSSESRSFLDSFSQFISEKNDSVDTNTQNTCEGSAAQVVEVTSSESVQHLASLSSGINTTVTSTPPCTSTAAAPTEVQTGGETVAEVSRTAESMDVSSDVTPQCDEKTRNTDTEASTGLGLMDMLCDNDGDSNDVDFFTAALQQLTDTNKKAEEMAEKKKAEEEKKKETQTSSTSFLSSETASLDSSELGIAANKSLQRVQTLVLQPDSERSSSPVSMLPRVNSPSLLTQRIGSPSLLQHRVGSPIGFQSQPSTPQIIKIMQGDKVVSGAMSPTSPSPVLLSQGTPLRTVPFPQDGQQRRRIIMGSKTEPQIADVIKTELTDKDVSRLWVNDDIKLKSFNTVSQRVSTLSQAVSASGIGPSVPHIEDEVEEEDEELGHAETYAEYMPLKSKIGEKHPDPVVETSSLSSVEPPDIGYHLSIPENVIDCRLLSALQLESIIYSSQKHETFLPSGDRAGFLIGDGAGVGKGRTIAGIIFENYLHGRKRALWLSVSNDLKVDAERDLIDIGAGKIEVHALNKFKYAKISSHVNNSVKKGVIFATYSSLIGESQSGGKYKTRFKQLIHWLSKEFDGVIVFDECHRAKNLCPVGSAKPTKTGLTVLELQNRLPKARVVYASATGASEPRNMAYMTRLGLWGKGTPFNEFNDFINAVEKRGVGAMELVAMDMKLRGIYIARQLSFHGVSFKIDEIPLSKEYVKVYNGAVKLWVEARDLFQQAAELIDAEHRMKKTMWGQFWSAHQRFFKYMCISSKVQRCVRLARDVVKHGKCVVIGLQSTGEARTLEQVEDLGGELNDFVSTAKGVIQSLVEKHFPAPDRKKTMDLFGGNFFDDSPVPSPKGSKRKLKSGKNGRHKKARFSVSSGDSSSSGGDSSSDNGKSSADSDKEDSDIFMSSSDDASSDEDNFNPFGNGSDSDDDPWLKKKKESKVKSKPKSSKDQKDKENKKKKKKKEKKKKKSKKRRQSEESSTDDDFDDIDRQMDMALESAGLKSKDSFNEPIKNTALPAADAVDRAIAMKRELLMKIERLGDQLPANTLDELIDELGGPENVAEMTGRKGRVVSTDDGTIQYESRSEMDAPLEILNLTEKQRFMDGEKADRRAANQRRRVHITLELPWSADRAIQQFGRTHRSNQVSAPEYVFLISELAGEQRFASTVAKRLESLGALTHGDRRATESRDLSRFNFDNKYGRAALESVMKSILGYESPMIPYPTSYTGEFAKDAKNGLVGVGLVTVDNIGTYMLEKDYNSMNKFLNRILGLEVDLQNALFKFFSDTMAAVVLQAKHNGRWDMGIVDLGTSGENVKLLDSKVFRGNFSGATTSVTLVTVSVERGMSWSTAMAVWRDHDGEYDGFYVSTQSRGDKKLVLLAVAIKDRRRIREQMYNVFRPNSGQQTRQETLAQIKLKYKKVYPDDARIHWAGSYESSEVMCSHSYWKGACKKRLVGLPCDTGLRRRKYHILCGSVLSVWTSVERVLASLPGGHATRMQIIRLRTDDGKRIVGSLIPQSAISPLTSMLSDHTKSKPPLPTPVHHPVKVANPFDSPWERATPGQSLNSLRTAIPRNNSFPIAASPSGINKVPLINLTQAAARVTSPQVNVLPRVVVSTSPGINNTPRIVVNKAGGTYSPAQRIIVNPSSSGTPTPRIIVNPQAATQRPQIITTPRATQNPRLLGFTTPSTPVSVVKQVTSTPAESDEPKPQVLSMPVFL